MQFVIRISIVGLLCLFIVLLFVIPHSNYEPGLPNEFMKGQLINSPVNFHAMPKTYKLHITGRVQGVWYRASAKEKALSLGLTGKIWNDREGGVSVIVQGPEEKIMAFIKWCKQGPPHANVENVHSTEINDEIIYTGFEIVRKG